MLTINAGTKSEVTLRVVLESEECGREYFDGYGTSPIRATDQLLRHGQIRVSGRKIGKQSPHALSFGAVKRFGEPIDTHLLKHLINTSRFAFGRAGSENFSRTARPLQCAPRKQGKVSEFSLPKKRC